MRSLAHPSLAVLAASLGIALLAPPAFAQRATSNRQERDTAATGSVASAAGRQMTTADLEHWNTIHSPTLSSDGKYFAYVLAPNDGDATVVIRATAEGAKEMRFPMGDPPAPSGNRFGPSRSRDLVISGDSRWAAFIVYPTHQAQRRSRKQHAPVYEKVTLVNLATGATHEFAHVHRFAFSGEDSPGWLALQGYAPAPARGASGAASGGERGSAPAPRPSGSDLLLYNLTGGTVLTVGGVDEWAFDHAGRYLAYTVDAREPAGDGVQLRDLTTGVVRALDSDSAIYRQLTWADSGAALAVLRGRPDTATMDTLYSLLAFTGFGPHGPSKAVFNPSADSAFPSGMEISPDRTPDFSEDFNNLFFGIREMKPKPSGGATYAAAGRSAAQPGAPGMGGTIHQNPSALPGEDDPPSLILWHWKDPRLQSQQLVDEKRDRAYSYLSEYRLADHRFVRLAYDSLREVTLTPHQRWALGSDTRGYDRAASYDGRHYADLYAVDLTTGRERLLLRKHDPSFIPSPDGTQLLTWGHDGQWHVVDIATGTDRVITHDVPTSFVDSEDDHNNLYPPAIRPRRQGLGWSADSKFVLLSDGWDVWKVPVHGGTAVNLTHDGKAQRIRYERRYAFDPKEKGIDLTKPLYFAMYGEWTKKEGLARVDARHATVKRLVWDDAKLDFTRARKADVFLYTRQTSVQFPDWYVASADFSGGRRITDADPQQRDFAWSSGARLITYVSDKGDTLQGALYLPANYQPGTKYPLLVTIYEKRSQYLHQYVPPSDTRTPDPSVYTSRGYAVLDPDIVYRVNDPGMSAVWCVVPAVKAAIATGIVDSSRVGLWGHSWGGYQTAFLVTQTHIFKAAVAGAPLTDMVSMYSSIYWNTGNTNQGIFEASQGRFKGNFTDNLDAYLRNSPDFHAANVTTPLIILSDDKDGAVDFNQGITYFNTLRQLGKKVILLEYVGENHGLRDPVNQRDYAMRMRQFFDHYLLGAPAPDWLENGEPRIRFERMLTAQAAQRRAKENGAEKKVTARKGAQGVVPR
ncbi:MAG TPA: prolyl oligopeptidase family serine peptidase [Gemmatimonadaceae bacterium]|nr:prolyl oligopeptidase family serine peptidase [Gemmatimonadaceae bacterium]